MKKLFFSSILLLGFCLSAEASHIKGGHITYKHREGRSYTITLTIFSDRESPVAFGDAGLDFGDGTSEENFSSSTRTPVKENTWKHTYIFEHTYPSSGRYLISYKAEYRTGGIQNVESSSNTHFFIESMLVVDPIFKNNSVVITKAPIHQAYLGETYHYNPHAIDVDGDSLSYHLTASLLNHETPVAEYVFPHLAFDRTGGSETGERAFFTLNTEIGDLIWDAPVRKGLHNITYEIREWRLIDGSYVEAGMVMHDMLIEVKEGGSAGLELFFPIETNEVLLEEGIPWEVNIRARADNPEDTIILMLSGSLLQQETLQLNPADSSGSKGETSITIRFTPEQTSNSRYQLIANAYLYSKTGTSGITRTRSAYLLSPGFISGVSDLPVQHISIYPNPVSGNRFFLDYALLNGREVTISLFTLDGRMVYHTNYQVFSTKEPVRPDKKLSGYHLALIRQGSNMYSTRILFLD